MKPHALTVKPPGFHLPSTKNCRRHVSAPALCRRVTECSADAPPVKRRGVLVAPLVALGAYALRSAVAKADVETPPPPPPPAAEAATSTTAAAAAKEEVISSRIYDATVIGEPLAVGKDKRKVWEKMMNARIVYLGEAEQVPTGDDKEVEVEIVKNLRKRCAQLERNLSLALEAFPCDLQEQLDRYMDKSAGMGAKNRKRKTTLNSSDDLMQQPLCTSTRTQVGRRVSNAAAQERQNHDQILPNTSNTISMADEVQTGHEKKHRGPTHMMEIWGRPSSLPRIQLDFDRFGRPIGPNQSKFCEFLGTVARNGMYCPLDVEDWHKMPGEYKKKMLHIVKSRYDIALGDEGWILSSINKKWRNWKSNLKTRYFVEDKNVDDLLDERDGRVLEDQWVNMLAYWNKEEVKVSCLFYKICIYFIIQMWKLEDKYWE